MREVIQSKKFILSVFGIAVVVVLAAIGKDPELVKWVGGFVTGIVSAMNVAQGLADGLSRGRTSASRPVDEVVDGELNSTSASP